MSTKSATAKILAHIDRDEIISKLLLGISPKDISDNLNIRYVDIKDNSLLISEKDLNAFKKHSLDLYKTIRDDLQKTTTLTSGTSTDAQLAVTSNPQYKDALLKLANNELDVKTMLGSLIINVENRIGQIFDEIQSDPRNINTRTERLLNEYIDRLQGGLEKWHKYILQVPDQTIQHNISIQHIDSHITIFHDVIKRVLSNMDIETSLLFMELFNEEIGKLKVPVETKITPVDERFAEVKVINDQINKQLSDGYRE